MHGPDAGSWTLGASAIRWPGGIVSIVDTVAPTIKRLRLRRLWKRRLREAIAMWTPAGVGFTVIRQAPVGTLENYCEPIRGKLRISRNDSGDQKTWEFTYSLDPPTALVTINWYPRSALDGTMAHTLAHEIGHALGLGHRLAPLSIMGPDDESITVFPDAHDLASVREWYFPATVAQEETAA